MSRDESMDRRTGLIVAAASAAVTLASTVTLATLLGYVQPGPSAPPAEARPAVAPRTILVPIQPDAEVPRVGPDGAEGGERLMRVSGGERRGKRRSKRDHDEHDEHERRGRRGGHDDD